jgi:hypothetical protein
MVEPETENVLNVPITSEFLVRIIDRLWLVYGKTDDDMALRNVFISQAQNGEIFWTFHKVIRHCEFFKWNILVGLAYHPNEYYQKWIEPYEHALNDNE